MLDCLWNKITGHETYALRRLCRVDLAPICSFVWAKAYAIGASYQFGGPADCLGPDTMRNWCSSLPHEWELVYERG